MNQVHWLGWVAIHHIPRVGAATAGREGLLLAPPRLPGPWPSDQFTESRLAPAGLHCRLCAHGSRTELYSEDQKPWQQAFLLAKSPSPSQPYLLLNVTVLAGLLHGLLLAAFTIAGGWHLWKDKSSTHTLAR